MNNTVDSLNNQLNEATNIIHSIIKKEMMDEHISEDEAKHRLGIEF